MLSGLVDLFLEEPAASIFRIKELYIYTEDRGRRFLRKLETVYQANGIVSQKTTVFTFVALRTSGVTRLNLFLFRNLFLLGFIYYQWMSLFVNV
jgi:hypothetical protein